MAVRRLLPSLTSNRTLFDRDICLFCSGAKMSIYPQSQNYLCIHAAQFTKTALSDCFEPQSPNYPYEARLLAL